MLNRRNFLSLAAAGPAALAARRSKLRIGVTDWNLRMAGKTEAVGFAASLGFEGVEVSLGRTLVDGKLPLDNREIQDQYLTEAAKHKIGLAGTCLDILHVNCGKSDKLAFQWIAAAIPITARLQAKVILLPFFGKCALDTQQGRDYFIDGVREHTRDAEKAKVTLALENTISTADNLRMMERAKSPAVKMYFDFGNLNSSGHDLKAEFDMVRAEHVAQIHIKDNPSYLGEGKIDMPWVMSKIMGLGFEGWANLETNSPSKDVAADMRRNLSYVRKLTA
jgi:sugar phosphate isomerase/epimerase